MLLLAVMPTILGLIPEDYVSVESNVRKEKGEEDEAHLEKHDEENKIMP